MSASIAKGGNDALEWLVIGQRLAEVGIAEYAYHCFYMAHLLNPRLIKTNSELAFDTAVAPNSNASTEGANLDDIIGALLSDDGQD